MSPNTGSQVCAWGDVEACDCAALINLIFILLEKVIQVLFLTVVSSSCLFDYANSLERCTTRSAHCWMCCMALQGCGCGQLGPWHFLAHPALH